MNSSLNQILSQERIGRIQQEPQRQQREQPQQQQCIQVLEGDKERILQAQEREMIARFGNLMTGPADLCDDKSNDF